MKFTIKVSDGTNEWTEDYDKVEVVDAQKWAEDTVAWFNSTLRPGEKPRKLIGVTVQGESDPVKEHDWGKQNLVTVANGGAIYDVYKCKNCGVSGRRYGLGERVLRDTKFSAKIYENCDKAKSHLEKLER